MSMTPHRIEGMKLRGIGYGIGRTNVWRLRIKKDAKSHFKYQCFVKKDQRERAQYEKANRQYSY